MSADARHLVVSGLTKSFAGNCALSDVNFEVSRGELLAIVGENGAGKSTLMKLLGGVLRPDSGTLSVDSEPVEFHHTRQAMDRGVVLIHQELNLAENLDIASNVFLGREPQHWGFLKKRRMIAEARPWLEKLGLKASPRTLVANLSVAQQQLVELAKALTSNARILIMDEPTASLTEQDAERLFGVIDELRSAGVTILYVSHRLGEVEQLADRALILRDGKLMATLEKDEITRQNMVRHMVDHEPIAAKAANRSLDTDSALVCQDLRTRAFPTCSISFKVRRGEVVGLGGLVGSGRSELLETIFGVTPPAGGHVALGGRRLRGGSPHHSVAAGMGLVTEDRKQTGLLLDQSMARNLTLPTIHRHARAGFLGRDVDHGVLDRWVDRLNIRSVQPNPPVRFLSGGNQQKVVLAKWLESRPRILLMDEPTRGVDVRAKEEIYGQITELAQSGVAVLMVSSESEELLRLSHRILVMHEGRLSGELKSNELTEQDIMELATGGTHL